MANISVLNGARPIFCRPCTIPFAMQALVAQELQSFERNETLSAVQTSEWAAPIVPVLKKDGTIRICNDFELAVNRVATKEVYLVHRLEEMWAKLAGGRTFSKLDLHDSYQQVKLEPEAKRLVTINTHRGLFQYNSLPFGVASAPAIFQREMRSRLSSCKQVMIYIEDILITGVTKEEHYRNPGAVLKRLQEARLKLKLEKCSFF